MVVKKQKHTNRSGLILLGRDNIAKSKHQRRHGVGQHARNVQRKMPQPQVHGDVGCATPARQYINHRAHSPFIPRSGIQSLMRASSLDQKTPKPKPRALPSINICVVKLKLHRKTKNSKAGSVPARSDRKGIWIACKTPSIRTETMSPRSSYSTYPESPVINHQISQLVFGRSSRTHSPQGMHKSLLSKLLVCRSYSRDVAMHVCPVHTNNHHHATRERGRRHRIVKCQPYGSIGANDGIFHVVQCDHT